MYAEGALTNVSVAGIEKVLGAILTTGIPQQAAALIVLSRCHLSR